MPPQYLVLFLHRVSQNSMLTFTSAARSHGSRSLLALGTKYKLFRRRNMIMVRVLPVHGDIEV